MNNLLKLNTTIILTSLLFTGCSSNDRFIQTPFLADMRDFKEHPIVPHFYTLNKPQTIIKKYKYLIIDDPIVSLSPNKRYQYVSPTHLKSVADTLRNQVLKEMQNDFVITSTPTPDTLRLRLAISNIAVPSRERAISVVQGGFIPLGLDGASIEGYLEHSLSGELLEGVRDERIGRVKQRSEIQGYISPTMLQKHFTAWSGELRAVLSEKFSKTAGQRLKEKNKIKVENDTPPEEEPVKEPIDTSLMTPIAASSAENAEIDKEGLPSASDLQSTEEEKHPEEEINYSPIEIEDHPSS